MANTVLSRARPGLDPQGLHVGGFTLLPALTGSISYDDNIFDDGKPVTKSAVFTIEPSVSLHSNWAVNQLNIDASGLVQRYSNASEANFDQYRISAAGQFTVASDITLNSTAHFDRVTEPRGTAGDISIGDAPVVYRTFGGSQAATVTLGRIQLNGSAGIDRFVYDDVNSPGVFIPQGYRNRNAITFQGQGGWQFGPGLMGFVQAVYDKQHYDIVVDDSTLDSRGWTLEAGVDFKITNLIVGRIGVGYLHRSYQNSDFKSINAPSYDATITWNVTTLVTATLTANKTIEESPDVNVSGIIENQVGLKVDWEILRNLLLNGRFAYTIERYRGLSRTDKRAEEGAGLRYLVNRYVEVGLDYDRRDQDGQGLFGRSYDGDTIKLSLRLQR